MANRSINELPVESQEAIQVFAAKYGRTWKAKLGVAWGNGSDTREHLGHALRTIRNNPYWGHDWLDGVKL
jgi:hypothetical protein